MNTELAILIGTYFLVAALIIAQPWMARKNVVFGVVFGSADVWNTEEARAIRSRYLKQACAAALIIFLAMAGYYLALRPGAGEEAAAFTVSMFLMIAAGTVPYVLANRRMKAFKASAAPDQNLVRDKITIETGIGEGEAILSAGWTFFLLPLLLAAVALVLFGYGRIPAQIPIHYGFSGPDAWTEKTLLSVLAPVGMNAALTAIIWFTCLFSRRAPASVRGNPQAAPDALRYRKYMILTLIFTGVLMQGIFLLTVIGYFTEVPVLLMNALAGADVLLIAVLLWLYFRFVRVKKPKGQILDDDAKWALGMFYYNKSDPSVFVEKRVGIGYTMNFARPVAWLFLLGVVGIVLFSLLLV